MSGLTFWGYQREDGSYGVRNYVAIISASDNANFVARRIGSLVKGTVVACPSHGRGEVADDLKQHIRTLSGLGCSPNVYACIVVAMEPVIANKVANAIRPSGKRTEVITIDDFGGSMGATIAGVKIAERMVIEASMQKRVEVGLDHLCLGLECGGSDPTSGAVANPATGFVADRVVAENGTVILSETAEWMGAEHVLAKRAATPELGQRVIDAVQWYEDYMRKVGVDIAGTNPAPDNIKGGLSTIEEKSLGAIKKAGSSVIQDLIKNAERPKCKGLVLMDAPPPGVENITAVGAAGCQAIIFCTGKGNAIGNPVCPTIKVTGNPRTANNCGDNIDVDLSKVVNGSMSLEEAGEKLLQNLLDHLNGKLTTAEILGDTEVTVTRDGYTV